MANGKGKDFEKNWKTFSEECLGCIEYRENRSGIQNGYDAFAVFSFLGKDFSWKFECKDENGKDHASNWGTVKEINHRDFSEKIMQIMGKVSSTWPDVLCIVFPHKVVGKNNILREDILVWNQKRRFPFKIVVWDFKFLSTYLPSINHKVISDIYPSCPIVDISQHDVAIKAIEQSMARDSLEGRINRKSYEAHKKLLLGTHTKGTVTIEISQRNMEKEMDFFSEGYTFSCPITLLKSTEVTSIPLMQKVEETPPLKMMSELEADTPSSFLPSTVRIIDRDQQQRDITLKTNTLVEDMKLIVTTDKGQSLYDFISSKCLDSSTEHVLFVTDQETWIDIPFGELHGTAFAEESKAIFIYTHS